MPTAMLPPPPGLRQPRAIQALGWVVRPEAQLLSAHRALGDVFTLVLPFGPMVVLVDPDDIKAVFTGDPAIFEAGAGNAPLEPVVGARSTLLLDGATHLRRRRLLLAPFKGSRLERWRELMAEIAHADLDGWPVGEPFAVEERTKAMTLEVILRVVFGIEDARRLDELRHLFGDLLPTGGIRVLAVLPVFRRDLGPRSPWGRFLARRDRIDALLYDEIARRREAPDLEQREDVLSMLLLARDEDGRPLTDSELRDELMTLLLAGHETTATALAWSIEMLVRHPEAHARARGDAAYRTAVVHETLRLRPPLPMVVRQLAAPAEVAGRMLPAGARVAPCIWLVNRRPDLYPDPHAFRPERFLGKAPETYSWLPFGGGVRRCVGASFAITEMEVMLEAILERAELAPSGPPERSRRRAIVLAPSRGSQAVVERLSPRG